MSTAGCDPRQKTKKPGLSLSPFYSIEGSFSQVKSHLSAALMSEQKYSTNSCVWSQIQEEECTLQIMLAKNDSKSAVT